MKNLKQLSVTFLMAFTVLAGIQEANAQRKFLRKNGYNPTALGSLMKTKDNNRQIQEIGIGSDKSFKVAYKKARLDLNSNLSIKLKSKINTTQTQNINSSQGTAAKGMEETDTSISFEGSTLVESESLLSRVEIVDNIEGVDKKSGMWMIYLKGEIRFKNQEQTNNNTAQ